ncbi:neurofilament heavy polypeptide-like isoform X4 [Cyprinodon tularosa]|uniref:neurofilament heavy polypeptide-like isoform X4 n=1 Tax=Cyprinodon tularosa TaxID=77115 RepID=UPI0018E22B83|nr:neurofilament heavy polypeptide-like isoform X4 [Cyprinodon tularosa]
MDRYDTLELEVEDGGNVAQKASLFGGMFKKPSKTTEPSAKAQDTLSANGELSTSRDSLTENSSSKEKGGMLKGMFKRTTKPAKDDEPQEAAISSQHPELSGSSDSLTDNKSTKDKSGMFGILKRSPRPGHARRPSQDLLDFENSNENLSENNNKKESPGKVKNSLKANGIRAASKEDLTAQSELSKSNDSLSKTKESGGFSSFFKNPFGARAPSQEDLTGVGELSGSSENLSENNTKDKGFFGMFKKKVARSQSQDDLSVDEEHSANNDDLTEKSSKSGPTAKNPKNPSASSAQEKPKRENGGDSSEMNSASPKAKPKRTGFSAVMKSTFYSDKQEKNSTPDDEETSEGDGDNPPIHKQSKLAGAMTKLNPFTQKQEKPTESDDEDQTVSSEKSSTHKQSTIVEAMSKLNPFHSGAKKDIENPETFEEKRKLSEKKPDLVKSNLIHQEGKEKGETPRIPRRPRAEEMKATSLHEIEKQRKAEEKKELSREKRGKASGAPVVPLRPTDEEVAVVKFQEMNRAVRKKVNQEQSQPGDEGNEKESDVTKDTEKLQSKSAKGKKHKHHLFIPQIGFKAGSDEEESLSKEENEDEDEDKPEKAKVKKPKKHNPFMPRVKAASDDEGLKDEEEIRDEEEKEKPEKPKVKKPRQHNPFMSRLKAASDDEGLKDEEESSSKGETKDENKDKPEKPKAKKPKQHNPFMPRPKAASDDEGLKDEEDSSSKEETKDDEDREVTEKPKVRKPKKHNPFMPRLKTKVVQRNRQDGAAEENEEPQRSLFDRLEDFRIDPSQPEDSQDVEDLMDWWNTVESWEDTPQDDDMTEKEEAKAFAVTAEKVQKGIRVFNKLFSERAETLWQHVIDLNAIADGLDKFNKKTKIAQITGGSTSAIGGVATITGLALAPVTMGTSLIVTAVGLGVATAGGLTSAGAGISNQVNNSLDRKKVEKIVEDYQEKIADLNKCLKFIKQGIENLRRFDLLKMKKNAYNQDFPALTSQFYEDGAMAGKAILINANEIMRVVQIANVAGSTAARAVQIASMATGVLTGLFVGMDIYFVAKDSKELKKGAKSEFAAKIREVATQLHDGLVELNTIREELQTTTPENDKNGEMTEMESEKKQKSEKNDESSDEDEIDRIKKAIKKDIESREYV